LSGVDPAILCHLHAAEEGCELDDEAQWLSANPGLDVFRDRENLAAQIRKAQRLPAEEPKVRNLLLNRRVSPVSRLISRAEWMSCTGEFEIEEGEEIYLGLDLSSTTDVTALIMVTANGPGARPLVLLEAGGDVALNRTKAAGTERACGLGDCGRQQPWPSYVIDERGTENGGCLSGGRCARSPTWRNLRTPIPKNGAERFRSNVGRSAIDLDQMWGGR
jgi:hypothetical protein